MSKLLINFSNMWKVWNETQDPQKVTGFIHSLPQEEQNELRKHIEIQIERLNKVLGEFYEESK